MRSMDDDEKREAMKAALRQWGKRQKALTLNRDPLVLACLELGISIEEIHQSTGLGRSTIDRIKKENEQ